MKQPTQQELIEAILAAWKRQDLPAIPHNAWAIYAAHAIEQLMGWKSK